MEINYITFNILGDERGNLVALEEMRNVPFKNKRVYYLTDTNPEVVRGYHAHKSLKQVLICVNGSCKIGLDNGQEKEEVVLDEINKGIYIDSNIWRTMYDFTDGCVLLVLASEYYNENDYIRKYEDYLSYIKK